MKAENGEEIVIFSVKMDFDSYHNYINSIVFRAGDPDEKKAEEYCIKVCGEIALKLNIGGAIKITLENEDTGTVKSIYRIRKNSESSELMYAEQWRIDNFHTRKGYEPKWKENQ